MTEQNATNADGGFDIASIKSFSIKLPIKHPGTGAPIGLTIELQSVLTPAVKAVRKRITDQRQKLAAKGKTFTAEQLDDVGIQQLVAATLGWEWTLPNASYNGEKIAFNAKNAAMIYTDLSWVASQIDDKLGEDEEFFRATK